MESERVEESTEQIIARDRYADHLGAELMEIKPGWARVRLKLEPHHVNFLGLIHGGVIFSLADVAFGAAANSYGSRAMALSVGIDFLAAPHTGDLLTAEVEQVSRAGKMAFYRMLVAGSDGKTIAQCHGWAYHTGKPLQMQGQREFGKAQY